MATQSEKIVALPPPSKPRLAEIGTQSLMPFTWYAQEEAYDFSRVSIPMLSDMLDTDGQAQSLYRLCTMPLKAGKINIKPDKEDKGEADFIKAVFFNPPTTGGLRTPWAQIVSQLGRALLTGAEVLEKVFEIREDTIHLIDIAPRPRTTLIFLRDDKGHFNGVKQLLPTGYEPIPLSNCLRWVVGSEFNPLYGRSMFLPAYYHYEKKHKLYYTGHIGFAINAAGIRIGHIPEDANEEEKNRFRRSVESLGFNTTIMLPEGFGLDIEHGNVPADMIPWVEHHNSEMANSVMGQVIQVGTGSGPGSFAVGTTHFNLFLMAEESFMSDISQVIQNDIVSPLIDWNFGTGHYPTFSLQPAYQDRRSVVQSIFERISSAKQVNTTPEFWLEVERAVAEELNIDTEIPYDKLKEQYIKDFKSQQKAVRAKPTPKLPAPGIPKPGGTNPPSGGNK
jgi:hypothetical protein